MFANFVGNYQCACHWMTIEEIKGALKGCIATSHPKMRYEYRSLLLKIARKLSAENLRILKFLWDVDFIPYARLPRTESTLTEVLDFFCKLEEQNKLNIDDLDFLKEKLHELNEKDLVDEVAGFQLQREAYLSSLSVDQRESERSETTRRPQQGHQEEEQRRRSEPEDRDDQQSIANQTSGGTIVMRCVPYLAKGVWAAGSAYLLNYHKDKPEALAIITASVVLPIGTSIKSIFPGSINFLLQATDLNSLKELWKRYQSGELKKDLQKVLVTEELKNLANGEPIDLVVTISEQEYRNACLDLMMAQTKAQALYKGITSSQHATQLSRSLPDLTSLDTIQNLSRDSLLAQLFDELKMRQNARVERPSSTVWSTENVSSLLEKIKSIQFEITLIEVLTGKSCYDETSSMELHMRKSEVYDRVKRTNLGFGTFMDQLEEAKMFLKNERFLLDPQKAVKRLVSFASRIKRYALDDDHLKIVLEEIFGVLPFISFQSSQIQFRASVRAVVTKLKEMAELLVKIFKLNPELLKVSKAMDDPPQRTTGTKIALLVAPSYKCLPARALPGTVHDLEAMRDITEKLQFDNVNEVGGEDATKDNILRSLDDLSSKASSGSIVLFYYCGHGYYLPSTKDEGLVPADATEQKLKDVAEDTCITGKDLQPFLEQFAKNKVKLTLIFDCCYSGQLYRVIELQNSGCTDVIPRQVIFQETLARSPPASDSEETGNKLLRGGWTPGEKDTFFYIAACSPVQVAYESISRGGRLTTAIKTVFDSLHDFPKPVSIMAFFRLIEREFKMKGWYQQQTPQLEGANLYIELFGARTCDVPSESQGITVEEVDGDEVILKAGCLQNLSPGLYDVFETTVSDIGVNHGKDCSDWLGSIDVTEGGIGQIQTSGLIVERNPDKDKKIKPECLAFLKTASNIKTNAWIKTTPEDSVREENIRVLLDHIKQTNILNVSTQRRKIEDKDLIIIGVELHGSSNQKQCWVARQGGDIIVPPLSLGSEEIMANNLNRYLRYQSALASAQPPKQDHELLKNVGVKVLRIEKVKPVKDEKQQRIQEGLQCGKDLYEDPYQCPVLMSHSLSGDPQMNELEDNTGDAFLFQVTNHNKEEKDTIHICVLFYQFDGAIKAIYPKGGMGCTKELRGDDTAEDICRVVIPFNSLRKMAEPDPSKPEPDRGVDTIVVYATSKPANFGPLLQTAIETDPALIARGQKEDSVLSDLAKFLLPIKQRCLEDHPDDMDFKWFVEKKEFAVVKNTNS